MERMNFDSNGQLLSVDSSLVNFSEKKIKKKKNLKTILVYTFIYRPLYLIPLILSLYKLAKGDIRWYTK